MKCEDSRDPSFFICLYPVYLTRRMIRKTFCLIISFVGLSMDANWVSELITLLTQRESTEKSNEKKPKAEK